MLFESESGISKVWCKNNNNNNNHDVYGAVIMTKVIARVLSSNLFCEGCAYEVFDTHYWICEKLDTELD